MRDKLLALLIIQLLLSSPGRSQNQPNLIYKNYNGESIQGKPTPIQMPAEFKKALAADSTSYYPGFTYEDWNQVANQRSRLTLLQWVAIPGCQQQCPYRWKVQEYFLKSGLKIEHWTDDDWIDIAIGIAYLDQQEHKISYSPDAEQRRRKLLKK